MPQGTDTQPVKKAPVSLRDLSLGTVLIASSAAYRPLIFWAENAWDLAAPLSVFASAAASFLIAVAALFLLARAGFRVLPTAYVLSGLIFIMFGWYNLPIAPPPIWLVAWAAGSIAIYRVGSDQRLKPVAIVFLALLLFAPAVQVAIQHYQQRIPYPLAQVAPPVTARATGMVEDVVILIVDSYPMLEVAREWFAHDVGGLEADLDANGFAYEEIAWSHNTFTGLSVPSIVQLDQVVDESPKGAWGNRKSSYEIVRGDNFVSGTLQNAGFQYTHIEGGWDGTVCGSTVDVCLPSPWLDESNWNLLQPSVLGPIFDRQLGSMEAHSTSKTTDHIVSLHLFDDGKYDYVYAHFMLPHVPYVVDAECRVVPAKERADRIPHEALRRQLTCVDSLLSGVVTGFGENTAVLITGDHGTGSGDPEGSSEEWTDAQIAERLGVLLAHRLPSGCADPESNTNLEVMRAIMACAVQADIPASNAAFMLGANEPVEVERERLMRIEDQLRRGVLRGPES